MSSTLASSSGAPLTCTRGNSLTTGSRQRAGALLLFGYTFRGQLTLCLGYDENGFAHGEIPAWWRHLLYGVDQHLLCKGTAQA